MEEEYNDSLKSKAAKGFLVGGFSNGLQQIFGAVFGIFLARILTPSDYGMVGMITIFSVIASAFQESGFVNGITNKKNVDQQDYNAVFWCSISISTIIYILLFFCAPLIALYFKVPELTNLSRLSFLSFWCGSFGIAHNAYLFRNLRVKERAISAILALLISNSIGIILAYNNFAYWGLAIQTVIYSLITSAMYWRFSSFRPTFNIDLNPIKEIFGFSSKIFISNVFININNHIYTIILGRYYTPESVGNVTQASKWSLMGQSLLSNMVTNVTQPILNQIRDDNERQTHVFRKILSFTAFLTFPALFGLALVSREFITIALGEKWINSADYLKILSIGGAFLTVSSVFSSFILSKGKSNVYMWSLIVFGICQTIILLLSKSRGIDTMIFSVCSLQIIWLFIWFLLSKRYIKYRLANLLHDVFIFALMAAITTVSCYFVSSFIDNMYLKLGFSIIYTIIIYTVLNKLFFPVILMELIDHAKKMINKN